MRFLKSACFGFSLLLAAREAGAQASSLSTPPAVGGSTIRLGAPSEASPGEAFGPGSQTTIIPVIAFSPASNTSQYLNGGGDKITPTVNGQQRWFANVNVPNGAVVDTLDVFVVDNAPASDVNVTALGVWFPVSGSSTCSSAAFSSATSAGITGQGHVVIAEPWQNIVMTGLGSCNNIDSYVSYVISVDLQTTSQSLCGARVVWHRVSSPAPATATFNDVPTSHPFFQFVEALAASGITAGCGGGNYCPNSALTRGQMAVFLTKALGLYWPN